MSHADVQRWIHAGELRRAASSLVVAYGPDVLATCIAMLRDRVAAEDVTQEVFGDALRALATFRGDSSPRTWLLSIARNRCVDYLRARKRDPWGGAIDESTADPDAHPDEGALGGEWLADRSLVMRALEELAEGDRALVVLRFRNGLDYGELASAFGLREGTVRMRISRALARMRQVLERDEERVGVPTLARGIAAPAGAPVAPGAMAPPAAARARAVVGAPPQRAVVSWWTRLREWAGLGAGAAELAAPGAPVSHPVGALGLALSALEPAIPSEALAARLGALVGTLAR
jgi:RNA polymerase sigma-70 factor (ECF subfamily)